LDMKRNVFISLFIHYMIGDEGGQCTLTGFRVAKKEIKARTKDYRTVMRVLRSLEAQQSKP